MTTGPDGADGGGGKLDDAWDEGGPDDAGPDSGPETGPDAASAGAPGEAGHKRRRRRRRRGGGERGDQPAGQPAAPRAPDQAAAAPPPAAAAPQPQRPPQQHRDQDRNRDRGRNQPRDQRGGGGDRGARGGERRNDNRGRDNRPRDDHAAPRPAPAPEPPREARPSQPPFEPIGVRGGGEPSYDDEDVAAQPAEAWGTDDGSPAPAIALTSAFPADAPTDDVDPVTFPLVDGSSAPLGDDIASLVGVRFVPAGRITWCDASDGDYTPGERVMVDAERGPRLGWIATVPTRKTTRDRGLRRVIRRANDGDLRGEREGDASQIQALRTAKDKAAALRLPLKVYRVETGGGRLNVYYTTDDRLDLRDFVRDVSQVTGLRVELRQLGVRDEAKAVGGIGSCGLTLCCTTWLPDFAPVSIKMAKDQGLVLSPTKVAGQCGRLKCCLVYEQATYAEMRKGLPKLGKRVVGARGEGRVVEVDVMRQRVRVSYGPGDTEVVPATEVKPLFPPGNQPGGGEGARDGAGGPSAGRREDRGDRGDRGGRERRDRGRDGGRTDRNAEPRSRDAAPADVLDESGPVNPGLSRDAFAARLAALNDPGAQVEPDDTDDTDDVRDAELTAGEKQAATRAQLDEAPAEVDDGFGDLPDDDPSRDPSRGDDDD